MEQMHLDLPIENLLSMLEQLRSRKTPSYAAALDRLIERLPPGSREARYLDQHRQEYFSQWGSPQ